MPCDDVTEILELTLDEHDRLACYRLRKRTCGRAVGEEDLLLAELAGQPETAILALDAEDFANATGTTDEAEYVLRLKHVFALQGALRALTGLAPAGGQAPIRAATIGYDGQGTTLEAVLSIDVITEQIKACGRCRGCGSLAAGRR